MKQRAADFIGPEFLDQPFMGHLIEHLVEFDGHNVHGEPVTNGRRLKFTMRALNWLYNSSFIRTRVVPARVTNL